jgi:hypothetical protein
MAGPLLPYLNLNAPEVGADEDSWGDILNDILAEVDDRLSDLANLPALSSLPGTGNLVRTGPATFAVRTITAGDGISITNGNGVSGNPTVAVNTSVVRTSRTVSAGTGLTGGGDLSADRTLSADFATQAEAEAGTNTTKVMTPERTAQHVTARIATQAEAEAGTNTTKVMTPERTAQHVAARIATQAEAEAGTNNTKLMTPLRTAQAIAALQPAPVIVGPVSTTSGTAFDVQNIPSWVRTITLNAAGISLSGTDSLLLQLGTDNAVITTGYASVSVNPNVGAGGTTNTTGFVVFMGNAGLLFHGHIRVDLAPGSVAVSSHSGSTTSAVNSGVHGGGSVAITDPITRIRLTRTGSNTFDNGSFFVRYSA